jgi:hypothetical protein
LRQTTLCLDQRELTTSLSLIGCTSLLAQSGSLRTHAGPGRQRVWTRRHAERSPKYYGCAFGSSLRLRHRRLAALGWVALFQHTPDGPGAGCSVASGRCGALTRRGPVNRFAQRQDSDRFSRAAESADPQVAEAAGAEASLAPRLGRAPSPNDSERPEPGPCTVGRPDVRRPAGRRSRRGFHPVRALTRFRARAGGPRVPCIFAGLYTQRRNQTSRTRWLCLPVLYPAKSFQPCCPRALPTPLPHPLLTWCSDPGTSRSLSFSSRAGPAGRLSPRRTTGGDVPPLACRFRPGALRVVSPRPGPAGPGSLKAVRRDLAGHGCLEEGDVGT